MKVAPSADTALETVAFRMQLNPGMQQEYQRRHEAIWPELAQALLDAGVLDYWIFFDPATHALFAFLQRRRDHTLAQLPQTEIMQRWWAYMADLMLTDSDCVPVQVALPPVFHLGASD